MTYKEVATLISSFGLPYAYYQFEEGTAQPPPFICFFYPRSEDLLADDTNYQKIRALVIELYTDYKDFSLEETIETRLTEAGLVYARSETYLDDEKMFEVVYETSIVVEPEQQEENNG